MSRTDRFEREPALTVPQKGFPQTGRWALMYHYIRPVFTGAGIFGVTPEVFALQVRSIKSSCVVTGPDDFATHVEGPDHVDDHSSRWLFTFDDGLRDHVEYALPALTASDIRAIFFVLSGPILTGRVPITHRVHLLRQKMGEQPFWGEISRALPAGWAGETDDYSNVYRWDDELLARMKTAINYEVPYEVLDDVLAPLVERHLGSEPAMCHELFIGVDDIRHLAASGMTIGMHGHTHRMMSRLEQAEQRREVETCRDFLDDLVPGDHTTFCYPFGKLPSYNEDTKAVLRECGIRNAFTSIPGRVAPAGDPLAMPRVDPSDIFPRQAKVPGYT